MDLTCPDVHCLYVASRLYVSTTLYVKLPMFRGSNINSNTLLSMAGPFLRLYSLLMVTIVYGIVPESQKPEGHWARWGRIGYPTLR